ncbi:hypothetical protein [Bradyrhizobium sp. sBnM-33]|uniref:hypothetical protein n=1 Tax=Bradyrhizobium sp. sBnM-33 TaxID=2831780 RepID=UPI001BCE1B5B|nr:hypothetical protein [Bradyrhizobium sp. sBnM-33]WOH53524.1 hypothetical protein RX328_16390 [Bradyrhizobium sp. sBnM-33]
MEDDGDREAVGDDEPSLGSFDRMMNQEKSYRQTFGEADAGNGRCPMSEKTEEDCAAINDQGNLLCVMLAQPDADSALNEMHRIATLIGDHARAIRCRNIAGVECA